MKKAQKEICDFFNDHIVFSKSIWTLPVGIKSDKFLNCLAMTYTELEFKQTEEALKHIEQICGSRKEDRIKNIVKMDIDILLFGNKTFHDKDWSRKYVKDLVKDL